MKRRTVLSTVGLLLGSTGLAGCSSDGDGRATPTPTPGQPPSSPEGTETPTATQTPNRYVMTEGDPIVEVTVEGGYDGEVVLNGDCREGDVPLEGGERGEIVRNEDAETCDVTVTVDGETVFEEAVQDYESFQLTVTASGEIEKATVVV